MLGHFEAVCAALPGEDAQPLQEPALVDPWTLP